MEFRFALRDNGMRAAFQLLHMVLEVWVFSLLHNILTCLTIGKAKFSLKHEVAFTQFTYLCYSIMCG
jgi:hypothetical protein